MIQLNATPDTVIISKMYPLVCAAPPTSGQVLRSLTRHQVT